MNSIKIGVFLLVKTIKHKEKMSLTIQMLKSKIHKPRVTGLELNYEGSIKVDLDIIEMADMFSYEKVQVVNNNNGSRFETYLIPGKRGSGEVELNGACSRLAAIGDEIIIMTFVYMEQDLAISHLPKVVLVDEKNKIKSVRLLGQ